MFKTGKYIHKDSRLVIASSGVGGLGVAGVGVTVNGYKFLSGVTKIF